MNLVAFDSETDLLAAGYGAPNIVCASSANRIGLHGRGRIADIHDDEEAFEVFERFLTEKDTIAFANAAFDSGVIGQKRPHLLPLIFKALREGRIFDILIAQALDAIAGGHLGLNPDGSTLRSPSTRKPMKRYSLEVTTDLVLHRSDAKANDVWRLSYALLRGIPLDRWPEIARQYPIDDAANTLEVAIAQIEGVNGAHEWIDVPPLAGGTMLTMCKHCNEELTFNASTPTCHAAPKLPHRNAQNHAAQCEAAFALHLGACWGFRSDPDRVEALTKVVEAKHAVAVERFQKKGWIRADGTEDTAAVKRAIAKAYGVTGTCKRCDGTGTTRNVKLIDCRGAKVKARFQGCQGPACDTCGGREKIQKLGNEVTCKNIFDEDGRFEEAGCDGTGWDLTTAPMLPRSDKLGVKTDRDAKMESGDDDLYDYGEDEVNKIRDTYLPYIREGVHGVIAPRPNVLVASGRCSYDTIHQFPRKGGVRECIRARGAWSGSPIEYVLCSSDYAAGELSALAQITQWHVGYSKMLETINATKDPGSLHTKICAQMLGISFEEAQARIKAGDKQAKDFRQAGKSANFGFPGGLGAATLVLTNRRKGAGSTTTQDGHEYAGIRFCVLMGGAERCGIEKTTTFNGRDCAPVCLACVRIVQDVLKPAFFETYPEVKAYLNKISAITKEGTGTIQCIAWNAELGRVEVLRERGQCGYTDGANQGFQGLLSDIGKRAFVRMTREGYLGVKDDGSPSVLAGARFPVFLHDEPLAELPAATAHEGGYRISEIMMECGRELAPDVFWKAEPALMQFWYKGAEAKFNENGRLIPWEPEEKQ